ncbi:DUF4192 family protein [Arthrobacter sp. NPDC058192]|uniref:DUF4192 family protein n=1 Tax=Arthrobacter sp. NPDC058192 TaxID=3346372 RepID=UPI0036E8FA13
MTAPDHLRITGPEDILGFIPHSLGYWPEHSLVAMTLQGKRLGATLRVDLPALGGGGTATAGGRGGRGAKRRTGPARKDGLAGFARNVVSYLEADDAADGALLAFFTGTATGIDAGTGVDTSAGVDRGTGVDRGASSGLVANGDDDRTVWADLLAELELALEAAGMPLKDAWIVGTEFWRNAHCVDPECCGPAGRPVEEIRNSRLNAEMVFRGSSVGAAPGADGEKTQPPAVDPAIRAAESGWAEQFSPRRRDRAQFAQVLDVWTMVMNQAVPKTGAGNSSAADSESLAKTPEAGTADSQILGWPLELSAELTGYLRASLCIPSWRDAVLVMAAAGRHAAERGAEDFGMFDIPPAPGLQPSTASSHLSGPTPSPILMPAPGPHTNKEDINKEAANKEPVSKEAANKEPASKEAASKVPASKEAANKEPANKVSANKEPADRRPADRRPAGGGTPGDDAVPGYGEVLLGLAPPVPDWALMDGLERVMELLGRLGGGEPTAAAVTARGWIEWCRGRGSYADALYRQALRERPDYRLAELLAELGGRGTLCGWAARREAAWQKFAPDAA